MAANSTVLTCSGASFNPSMTSKTKLVIPGIGRSGADVTTVITSYKSPSQVTVDATAYNSISGQAVSGNTLYGIQEILYPSAASSNPCRRLCLRHTPIM